MWDIEKAEYVTNSGLPDTADNIALDGPRNRLAVAANERITIYELDLAEQTAQMDGKLKQLVKFSLFLTIFCLFFWVLKFRVSSCWNTICLSYLFFSSMYI